MTLSQAVDSRKASRSTLLKYKSTHLHCIALDWIGLDWIGCKGEGEGKGGGKGKGEGEGRRVGGWMCGHVCASVRVSSK